MAFLGKTGSGKSNGAKVIVEDALDAGERVCILDPTGAWWGLRLKADESPSKYPVVIFGGLHGDVEIGRTHGAAVAEVVATSATPAVIDTRLMTVGERTEFFTAFAQTLLRRNRGPLHLVIDEAHLFAPQGRVADPRSGEMLHAANNLVSLGRSIGLRICLISQRPAKLHKDSLTQVETLVAMRLIAPQDRNAVEDWIGEWAGKNEGKEIVQSLPSLPTGDAWIWSPEINFLNRVHFPLARTYDSGKAPSGEEGAPELKPLDLKAVNALLEKAGEDIKANDPRHLKAEVARLKRELAAAGKTTSPDWPDLRGEVAALRARLRDATATLRTAREDTDRLAKAAQRIETDALAAYETLHESIVELVDPGGIDSPGPEETKATRRSDPAPRSVAPPTTPRRVSAPAGDVGRLPPGERAVLIAAVQYDGVDRDQLSVLTGYKRSSRDAYIARLRDRGLVEVVGQTIRPTGDAADALGSDYEPLPAGDALRDYWMQRLPPGEAAVLGALVEVHPQGLERHELDERTGYKRSSRDAYIQRLKARRLVVVAGSRVNASETLFS